MSKLSTKDTKKHEMSNLLFSSCSFVIFVDEIHASQTVILTVCSSHFLSAAGIFIPRHQRAALSISRLNCGFWKSLLWPSAV